MQLDSIVYVEKLAIQSKANDNKGNSSSPANAKVQITPDMTLLREKGGRPFMVLEFKVGKNEDADVLSDNESPVLGEAYEQMCALREVFGVRDVFCILTTYEQMRVLWLEDAEWLANTAEVHFLVVTLCC